MATKHLNKSEFLEKVVNFETNPNEWKFLGDKPAVLDFYAEWCGPCKRLLPVLESVSEEYANRVDIYKVNVDEEQELAEVFGVQTIPTLFFMPKEGNPQRSVGGMPLDVLKSAIDSIL